ncbi:hypothetical protein B0H16DRAFT_1793463 [Mycena metata]|uniref:Uncharacterized protein n=1 Tax=Mycena metata TaxID=1033252 RepID=A0AAD7HHW2_9AGAR|nr:hypothetical protein B0H16DRAFT_1793463 [Mycena metata]
MQGVKALNAHGEQTGATTAYLAATPAPGLDAEVGARADMGQNLRTHRAMLRQQRINGVLTARAGNRGSAWTTHRQSPHQPHLIPGAAATKVQVLLCMRVRGRLREEEKEQAVGHGPRMHDGSVESGRSRARSDTFAHAAAITLPRPRQYGRGCGVHEGEEGTNEGTDDGESVHRVATLGRSVITYEDKVVCGRTHLVPKANAPRAPPRHAALVVLIPAVGGVGGLLTWRVKATRKKQVSIEEDDACSKRRTPRSHVAPEKSSHDSRCVAYGESAMMRRLCNGNARNVAGTTRRLLDLRERKGGAWQDPLSPLTPTPTLREARRGIRYGRRRGRGTSQHGLELVE